MENVTNFIFSTENNFLTSIKIKLSLNTFKINLNPDTFLGTIFFKNFNRFELKCRLLLKHIGISRYIWGKIKFYQLY